MKNKQPKIKKIILAFFTSILLLTLLFANAILPAAHADESKIMVTDHDSSATFSVGDEFCLGEECFYIIENKDGNIRAISKYNLYAGGDTDDVSNNPAFQNITDWRERDIVQYSNGYSCCVWNLTSDGITDTYNSTRCYKPYDVEVKTVDLTIRTDLLNVDGSVNEAGVQAELGTDNYRCLDRLDPEGQYSYQTIYVLCYATVKKDITVKQDPEMLSAHNDESGKLVFPMRGNVYFNDTLLDPDYEIVLSRDYHDGYVYDNQTYFTNNEISYYLYEYVDYLGGDSLIKDVDLMSYNDLMHVLNDINPFDITFADDNYLIEDEGHFDWQEAVYDEGDPRGYTYWFANMEQYIPEQYKWIYDSTYWLSSGWYTEENSPYSGYTDAYGNTVYHVGYIYQFFVNTHADLCSVAGSCGPMIIPAGIRPVITMSADKFLLNEVFDINGTIRWEDNNDASKIRPRLSTIRLMRNDIEIDAIEVAKDEDEDLWRFSFRGLLKYDNEGNEYRYTITQDDVPLYTSDVDDDYNFVNRYASDGSDNPNTIDSIYLYGITLIATVSLGIGAIARKRR